MKSSKKLYWILAILSLACYAWIGSQIIHTHGHEEELTLCIFKNVTGIPCPSCGTTRSLLMLIAGDAEKSLMINPLGLIAALSLLIIPAWMITDAVTHKNTLSKFFLVAEQKIKTQKILYMPLVALVLINWGWNILKDL